MSSPSKKRGRAKWETKQTCMALLRREPGLDRFTFMLTVSAQMDQTYRNADELTQLAIYDAYWAMSERLPRRSPFTPHRRVSPAG